MEKPVFEHACDKCKFLGHCLGYDMYYANHEGTVKPGTIILRYGNVGIENISGINLIKASSIKEFEDRLAKDIRNFDSSFDSERHLESVKQLTARKVAAQLVVELGYLPPDWEKRIPKTDGSTRPATVKDMKAGVVLRMMQRSEGTVAPFSDFVVLAKLESGDWALARPYCYAHVIGLSATVLTGVEQVKIDESRLKYYNVVLDSRGEPMKHLMGPG